MSIEKFSDDPRLAFEDVPFTQVNNNVIQCIKNMQAGFVWVYLLSRPRTWKIVKEHLKSHFKMGDGKIKSIFSYLNKSNLISYERERYSDGTLGPVEIRVLNGSRFIDLELSTGKTTTGLKTTRVDNHTSGSGALYKKKNIKKEKSKKREGLSSLKINQQHQDIAKERGLVLSVIVKKYTEYCISIERTPSEDGLTSWLLNEKTRNASKPVIESRCTIPLYGRGHPTYDMLHPE